MPELHLGAGMTFGKAETVSQARRTEKLGFEYFLAREHYMQGNPPLPTTAALQQLGVATENILLLSPILLVPFYHPTVLAKLNATLDNASGGQLTLGVGIGGEFPMEFDAAGLDVRQRCRRSDECLDILRRLWNGDRVRYQGRYFQMDDVTLNPSTTHYLGGWTT